LGLTEEALCAEFGVSRSPVREALGMLVENGLVVTMNPAGTIIEQGTVAISKGAIVAVGPAAEIAAGRMALIGNINNPSTLLFKKPQDVRKEVQHAIKCGLDIIGPECAVPLTTPLENLKEISVAVREWK
jgi:uroporphyrinogen-III decarboxylase